MNGTLYLAVGSSTAGLGIWVVAAVELYYIASLVLDNFLTLDDIAMLQANLTLWLQAEELLWSILHEILLLNVQLPGKWHIAMATIDWMVLCQHVLLLALWIIGNNNLQWTKNCHHAVSCIIQIIPDAVLQHGYIHQAVGLGHAYFTAEVPQSSRSIATTTQSGNGRHPWIIPACYVSFFHQLTKLSLTSNGVGKVQTGKLNLTRASIYIKAYRLQQPVIKRTMILKLQGADGVGNALNGIRERMCEIIHWVNAPSIPGTVMGGMGNTVDNRITHIDIWRCHVDLGSQYLLPIGELAVFHASKEIHILLNAAVPIWAFLACLSQGATHAADFLGSGIIYIGLAIFNELYGKFIELLKVVRCIEHPLIPAKAQPFYILLDGIHIFHVFLYRICIIKAEVAQSIVLLRQSKVQANGLGVANMEIAIWLWRKTGVDTLAVTAIFQVVIYFILNKIGRIRQNLWHKLIAPIINLLYN